MAEYSESSAAKILVAPKRVNLRDAEWYKNHSEEEGGREDGGEKVEMERHHELVGDT